MTQQELEASGCCCFDLSIWLSVFSEWQSQLSQSNASVSLTPLIVPQCHLIGRTEACKEEERAPWNMQKLQAERLQQAICTELLLHYSQWLPHHWKIQKHTELKALRLINSPGHLIEVSALESNVFLLVKLCSVKLSLLWVSRKAKAVKILGDNA